MCKRCRGQMVKSYPHEPAACLLCGWAPIAIPDFILEEYAERIGAGVDEARKTGVRGGIVGQPHSRRRIPRAAGMQL